MERARLETFVAVACASCFVATMIALAFVEVVVFPRTHGVLVLHLPTRYDGVWPVHLAGTRFALIAVLSLGWPVVLGGLSWMLVRVRALTAGLAIGSVTVLFSSVAASAFAAAGAGALVGPIAEVVVAVGLFLVGAYLASGFVERNRAQYAARHPGSSGRRL